MWYYTYDPVLNFQVLSSVGLFLLGLITDIYIDEALQYFSSFLYHVRHKAAYTLIIVY